MLRQGRPAADSVRQPPRPYPTAAADPPPADPLSDSILFLASHHGRALTREALLAGLPISDDKLTVQLYERAALRAGLEIEIVERKIADIPPLVLPAVLIMNDGTTRILHEMSRDPSRAMVTDPSRSPIARPQPLGADA